MRVRICELDGCIAKFEILAVSNSKKYCCQNHASRASARRRYVASGIANSNSPPKCQGPNCTNDTKLFVSSGRFKKYCSAQCSQNAYQTNRKANDPVYVDHLRTLNRERNRKNYRESVSWRHSPNARHLVYVWSRDALPVYIGMSSVGESRAYNHRRDYWFTPDLDLTISDQPTRDKALEVELGLIKKYQPEFNIMGKCNGSNLSNI